MALWQMKFRSTYFSDPSGIYGSVNYTIPAVDMPEFPFVIEDKKFTVVQETDSGDIFKHRKFIRTEAELQFNSVQATTMIEIRKLFREDQLFIFYEDANSARSWTGFTNGTATCTILNSDFTPEMENDLFSFSIRISETTGTKNNG